TNTYSVLFDKTAVSPVVTEFEPYHMSNPDFTWSEAHDKRNARIDYYARLLGTDWWNNLHRKRAKKCAKNRVTELAKLGNKNVYYACRATIVHETSANDGLFQLGDAKSLVAATMRQNLGGIGQGRGRSR
ncbi:MAG: hypothetical protein GY847_39580, partial [Proteobacteria bacterium]|nr:hypothetical protein [Pseudomonadota bacterium]